jgi:hypothetical protein
MSCSKSPTYPPTLFDPVIATLKFLVSFEQKAVRFNFILGYENCIRNPGTSVFKIRNQYMLSLAPRTEISNKPI